MGDHVYKLVRHDGLEIWIFILVHWEATGGFLGRETHNSVYVYGGHSCCCLVKRLWA